MFYNIYGYFSIDKDIILDSVPFCCPSAVPVVGFGGTENTNSVLAVYDRYSLYSPGVIYSDSIIIEKAWVI